jgi:4-hydroxybenzoate polyprenyltransferase
MIPSSSVRTETLAGAGQQEVPGRPWHGSHAARRRSTLSSLVRALRPHQWVKNLLVLLPLVASHKIVDVTLWPATLLTFVVFSLSASAVYIVNDILDIEADRRHPRKRTRPFAAGDLNIPTGVAAAAALLALAGVLAAIGLPPAVAAIAAVYLAATTLYSAVLKRRPVLDVFALTGLYVLRIVAGGAATDTPPSSWLLAFALFFFLSLAFVKRYAEVTATEGWLAGRGYGSQDALWMQSVGTSSGYMAVVVMALYVNGDEVTALYTRPQVLGMLCPVLLLWITRLWFRAGRKQVHDDPVVEALRDRATYVAAAAVAVILVAAI